MVSRRRWHFRVRTKRPLKLNFLGTAREKPRRSNVFGCSAAVRPIHHCPENIVPRIRGWRLRRAAERRVEGVGPGPSKAMPEPRHHEQSGRFLKSAHASHFAGLALIKFYRLTRGHQRVCHTMINDELAASFGKRAQISAHGI